MRHCLYPSLLLFTVDMKTILCVPSAVIYETLDLKFTAKLRTTTEQRSENCFIILFSWTPALSLSNDSAGVENSSIYYISSKNQTGVISLGNGAVTDFVLNSSQSNLQPSTLYSFLLSIDFDFENGTLKSLTSFPANVTTPACSGK